jgi:hypothetical protein
MEGEVAGEFERELELMLRSFEYEAAVALSKRIHEAEEGGVVITKREDRLWEKLTSEILKKKLSEDEFLDPS